MNTLPINPAKSQSEPREGNTSAEKQKSRQSSQKSEARESSHDEEKANTPIKKPLEEKSSKSSSRDFKKMTNELQSKPQPSKFLITTQAPAQSQSKPTSQNSLSLSPESKTKSRVKIFNSSFAKNKDKFNFKTKRNTKNKQKTNFILPNEEEASNIQQEDEFIKLIESVIKSCVKSAQPGSGFIKNEMEVSSRSGNNPKRSDTNQYNLEDLLNQANEETKSKSNIEEENKTPSIGKQKSQLKVFSFKDQVITININPPIEEIREEYENEITQESPPTMSHEENMKTHKTMRYQFELNTRKFSVEDSLLEDF
jgi:hypothetical protein